ncbi:GAF domain-containing protein [candidate division KSB1 bacterium]
MVKEDTTRKGRREILSALIDKAGKNIPVEGCDIFLFFEGSQEFETFSGSSRTRLANRFQGYLEEGIVDWIISQQHPAVIEDIEYMTNEPGKDERNFVMVPVTLKKEKRAIILLYTSKPKQDFTAKDLDRLSDAADGIARKIGKLK